jgi:universal stress protein A
MFYNVLVPTNLSGNTRKAMEIALKLTDPETGRLHLLHVIETLADTAFEEFEEFYLKLEQKAQNTMKKFVALHETTGVPIENHIFYGPRAPMILRFCQEKQIDLIVMNSHRVEPKDPAQGWGTISYKVGILSPCPVMLVK